MTNKKPKKLPPPGLSERQAGAFTFDHPQAENTVKKVFDRIFSDDDAALKRWKFISAALAVLSIILAILLFTAGNPSISANVKNSTNTSVIGSARDVTINNSEKLNDWNAISWNEQHKLRVEAFALFPELLSDDYTTKYRRVNEWFREQKNLDQVRVRDIFTAGGRRDLEIGDKNYPGVPRIFYNLREDLPQIADYIAGADAETLNTYWRRSIPDDRGARLNLWRQLVYDQLPSERKDLFAAIYSSLPPP